MTEGADLHPRLIIKDCTVVDGMGNPPLANQVVIIDGERISEVVPVHTYTPSDSDHVIEAGGKTVMPGLIDAHCHMTYGESFAQVEQDIYTSVEGRTLRAAWNVQKVLAAGVTGISQPGGSYFVGVAVRDAIRTGRIKGPRMATSGRYISTSNGLTDFYPDEVGAVEGGIGIRCNTLDEMIAEVRRQVKNGVNFVKLADSSYGQFQAFRDEELKTIADLCHQLGIQVTIHARGDAEMRAAANAGFDWVMHGNMMSRETVELLAEEEIPLVPTLVLLDNWARYGDLVNADQPIIDGCKRMLERTRVSLHMAHEAGVKFVVGTDSGFAITPYGEWHARELELLVEYAGLSPLEAIQAATFNGGRTLNLEGKVGGVAPNMLADLLIVDGDPTADLSILQDPERLHTIIVGGEVSEVSRHLDSWPNERSRRFADRNLTRDLVIERRGRAPGPAESPRSSQDAPGDSPPC